MKKVLGWFVLFVSICWCFLMIPAFTYGIFKHLTTLDLSIGEMTMTGYLTTFIGISISVAIAYMVTKFGIGLLKSSWQLIRGQEVTHLSIRDRAKVKKHNVRSPKSFNVKKPIFHSRELRFLGS